MIKNSSKLIFLFSMMLGTLITISSNSWLGVWMGLEINLLSFIPLMIDTTNLMSTEASLNYFLTQAFASSMLIFSMILFIFFNSLVFKYDSLLNILVVTFISLAIKSGMAPFHFWFPNVMEGISWLNGFLLMTWQKIAPLLIISYFINFKMFYFVIILSVIMGAILGLNQISVRKIMAFSSINHLGWMLSAIQLNEYLWIFYFLIYSIISFNLIFSFNLFKIFYMNQMFSIFMNSLLMKFFMMISFLSLGGLPPLLGFLPKWLIIQSLMTINYFFLVLIMILMSLITLYFYLRISYSAFILNYSELMWNMKMNFNQFNLMMISMMLFLSIFGLFLFNELMCLFY